MRTQVPSPVVVHLGKYYSPDSGGIEEVTEVLAVGAAGARVRVAIECFTAGQGHIESRGGVEVRRHAAHRVVASQPLSWSYWRAAIRALARADIVHLHVPNILATAAAALAPRKRAALIVHWHSDIVGKGLIGWLVKPIEWLMLMRADAVVATSPPYAAGSLWLRRFRTKVSLIPLGVHDHFGDAHVVAPTSPPIVLAVGRLVPYKGFDALVEAAPLLNHNVQVIIVGDGPQRHVLQQRISEMQVEHRVRLVGRLPSNEVRSLYKQASLFCLPSVDKAEAFGVVLLEALSAGLPVVATNIRHSGVPWVNEHGVTGINIAVRDVTALAAACNTLLSDEQLRRRYATAARLRYEQLFTADRSVAEVLHLYTRVLAQSRPQQSA